MSTDNDQGAQRGPKGRQACAKSQGAPRPRPGRPSVHPLERAGAGAAAGPADRASQPSRRLQPGLAVRAAQGPGTPGPSRPAWPGGRLTGHESESGRAAAGEGGGRRLGARRLHRPLGPASATRSAHDPQAPPTAAGAGQVPTVRRTGGGAAGTSAGAGAGGPPGTAEAGVLRPAGAHSPAKDSHPRKTEELGWGRCVQNLALLQAQPGSGSPLETQGPPGGCRVGRTGIWKRDQTQE